MYDDEPDDYALDCEDEERDPFYPCGCDLPGCVMPGEHFASECHTAEDAEREYAAAEEPPAPVWDGEGAPVNLAAAAVDALEWLDLFGRRPDLARVNAENRGRMARCADALRGFLPERPADPA